MSANLGFWECYGCVFEFLGFFFFIQLRIFASVDLICEAL